MHGASLAHLVSASEPPGPALRSQYANLASALVPQRRLVTKVDTAGGAFQVGEDEPEPRVEAGLHRTL
jgi:hypothetical protein